MRNIIKRIKCLFGWHEIIYIPIQDGLGCEFISEKKMGVPALEVCLNCSHRESPGLSEFPINGE